MKQEKLIANPETSVILGYKSLTIYSSHPLYSLIESSWNFWTDLHNRNPGGVCVARLSGYEHGSTLKFIRFVMPEVTRDSRGEMRDAVNARHLFEELWIDIQKKAERQKKIVPIESFRNITSSPK